MLMLGEILLKDNLITGQQLERHSGTRRRMASRWEKRSSPLATPKTG